MCCGFLRSVNVEGQNGIECHLAVNMMHVLYIEYNTRAEMTVCCHFVHSDKCEDHLYDSITCSFCIFLILN